MVEMKWSLTAVVVNDEKEEDGEEQDDDEGEESEDVHQSLTVQPVHL